MTARKATGLNHRVRGFTRAIVKIARNPLLAWRLLWPRFSPLALAKWTTDPVWRRQVRWSFGELPRERLESVFPGIEAVDVRVPRAFDRDDLLSMIPSEVLAVAAVVRLLQPRRLLEIGTFEGHTTAQIAANSPPGAHVVTVDLPPDWDGEYAREVPSIDVNTGVGPRGRQFRGTPFEDKITQVYEDSATFDWERFAPFDFILIDGCHTYDYAVADTRNALRVLAPEGIVVWHDYGMLEDVSRAVDETARRMTVRAIRGTRLAVGFR